MSQAQIIALIPLKDQTVLRKYEQIQHVNLSTMKRLGRYKEPTTAAMTRSTFNTLTNELQSQVQLAQTEADLDTVVKAMDALVKEYEG